MAYRPQSVRVVLPATPIPNARLAHTELKRYLRYTVILRAYLGSPMPAQKQTREWHDCPGDVTRLGEVEPFAKRPTRPAGSLPAVQGQGASARLRAKGYLAVLDGDELSFTEDESIAVQRLVAAGGRTRSVDQMRHLHQLTNGWPAGLKLLQLENSDSLPAANGQLARGSSLFD